MDLWTAYRNLTEIENDLGNIDIEDRYEKLRQAQENLAEALEEEEKEEGYI